MHGTAQPDRSCRRCAFVVIAALTAAVAGVHAAAAQSPTPSPTPPATTAPAQANAPNCPANSDAMTFTPWTNTLGQTFGEGARDYIFADGAVCSDTDQTFQKYLAQHPPNPNTILVLNSGGGDLDAGMRMGVIVRQQKLWTEVGSLLPVVIPISPNVKPQSMPYLSEPVAPPFAGGCYSACNFIFMGGIHRNMSFGSNFGVHQFESEGPGAQDPNLQDITERISAQIVSFLNQMGVSPNWLVYMVQKRGSTLNDVTYLTMAQMQDLKVVTPRWQTKWQITPLADNSGFDLQGTTTDAWGTDTVTFACAPTTNESATTPAPGQTPQPGQASQNPPLPGVVATFALDPGSRANPQDLLGALMGYSIALSGDIDPIFLQASRAPPAQLVANRLVLTLPISRPIIDSVIQNEDLSDGVVAFLFNPSSKFPMRLLKFDATLDGPLLKQFVGTCH